MTRRIVSLLLIPLLLGSQGLCFGHSHRDTDGTQPVGHEARPHFHVHGHGHRHHGHGQHDHYHGSKDAHRHHAADDVQKPEALPGILPSGQQGHDDDAVYVSTSMIFGAGRWSPTVLKSWLDAPLVQGDALPVAMNALAGPLWSLPPPIDSACPRYLRNLSLRC